MEASWQQRSDVQARRLLDVMARFSPESAAAYGAEGVDTEILDLRLGHHERLLAAVSNVRVEFVELLAQETHVEVRQDLEILLGRIDLNVEGWDLDHRLMLPYAPLCQVIFRGLAALLDDQVAPSRHGAALVRLRRYAGLEDGYEPIAELVERECLERMTDPALLGPFRGEVEKDLANDATMLDGIGKLFTKYGLTGFEEPLAALEGQLKRYAAFVREQILPRCRTDFRLLPEQYRHALKAYGIDLDVGELQSRARVAVQEIQNEMQVLSRLISAERGWAPRDYRAVLAELKKEQLTGDAILAHYEKRIAEIEAIIVAEDLITLPDRKMRIRLASEAESAQLPAPHMQPPRLLGNTGEMGTFVLPLRVPGTAGNPTLAFDDFTFEAASWTLTAHEGRPGHELQFAAMVEKGVSLARMLFAFNSTNVEGWALYTEAVMKPFEPLEGQLVALQHRLLRATRAILDPGLQLGTITPEEASRVLTDDVVVSPAMALQEVERYTFRYPGQAPSYFCGYQHLMELRSEVERRLGTRFDRKAYHDFVVAQGLLPLPLLKKAVLREFFA